MREKKITKKIIKVYIISCLLLLALNVGRIADSLFKPTYCERSYPITTLVEKHKSGVVTVITKKAFGSGFVVRQKENQTLIITNSHVVGKSSEVMVLFPDGNKKKADVVLNSREKDMALLKLEAKEGKLFILKQKKPDIGSDVIAIGAPRQLPTSFTKGIVSAVRLNGRLIQHDAAINQGNSGGPLIETTGCVVGMNTFGIADSEGLGLAIASDNIQEFINKFSPDYSHFPSYSEPSILKSLFTVVIYLFLTSLFLIVFIKELGIDITNYSISKSDVNTLILVSLFSLIELFAQDGGFLLIAIGLLVYRIYRKFLKPKAK